MPPYIENKAAGHDREAARPYRGLSWQTWVPSSVNPQPATAAVPITGWSGLPPSPTSAMAPRAGYRKPLTLMARARVTP
jgi:hypothetical protein